MRIGLGGGSGVELRSRAQAEDVLAKAVVSREARQNLTALAIAAVVVALVVVGFSRPGAVLPISDETLADSVARNAGSAFGAIVPPRCRAERGDRWRCLVSVEDGGTSATRRYEVEVGWDGCWRGTRPSPERRQGSRGERERQVSEEVLLSGCVSLVDY